MKIRKLVKNFKDVNNIRKGAIIADIIDVLSYKRGFDNSIFDNETLHAVSSILGISQDKVLKLYNDWRDYYDD